VPIGIGALIGALPQPNDGVVAVCETTLPGATDHRVLAVNHVALTWAKEAVSQTVHFLRHGGFVAPEEGETASPEPCDTFAFSTGSHTDNRL
jgi:hypothetical protein